MTKKENALAPENEKPALTREPIRKEETNTPATVPVVSEKTAINEISDKNGFYLIAGSFVEMWRAEKYLNELKSKGFSPIIVNSDSKIRIAVSYSSDRKSADAILADHRTRYPDMAVWILKK